MWGRATLAMEVSSTSMKAARATVMAMSQGLTRGFQRTAAASGEGFCMVLDAAEGATGSCGLGCESGKNLLLGVNGAGGTPGKPGVEGDRAGCRGPCRRGMFS